MDNSDQCLFSSFLPWFLIIILPIRRFLSFTFFFLVFSRIIIIIYKSSICFLSNFHSLQRNRILKTLQKISTFPKSISFSCIINQSSIPYSLIFTHTSNVNSQLNRQDSQQSTKLALLLLKQHSVYVDWIGNQLLYYLDLSL